MAELKTIYISTYPIDCHILKGRLESEGLTCFIFDENIVWVHPFYSVLIGGVKLKVPEDQLEKGQEIIAVLKKGLLTDSQGDYEISPALEYEIDRQNMLLELKSVIRGNPSRLNSPDTLKTNRITPEEFEGILKSERKFQEWTNSGFKFTWEQFWYELFDFDRSFFRYLRPRPVEYYLEKELTDNYNSRKESGVKYVCPKCNSDNVSYGYAMDGKWDILFLIVSLLIFYTLVFAPSPPTRKNCHCFNCGYNFKPKKS